jgi:hypothetical protein
MNKSRYRLCFSFLLAGCGGSTPESAEPGTAPSAEPADDAWTDKPAVGVDEGQSLAAQSDAEEPAVTSENKEQPLGAEVEETRTLDVIRAVVAKNRDEIRACFDALSKEEKGNGGMLTIAFEINPQGDVRTATLNEERTTIRQPKLASCATAAFKTIKFPASSRGFESTGNYPFNFKP